LLSHSLVSASVQRTLEALWLCTT